MLLEDIARTGHAHIAAVKHSPAASGCAVSGLIREQQGIARLQINCSRLPC